MTTEIQKQLKHYYIYSFLIGTWFASAIWVFFSRRFLTDTEIGIFDSVAFGFGLLIEIPSGSIADYFGRRRTVIAGTLIYAVGYGLWGLSVNSAMVLSGFLLIAVGGALQSGADEAMFYDYLKARNHEHLWPRISINRAILARMAFVVALAIGGLAYSYYDRLPFIFRTITLLLMLIPLAKLALIDKYQQPENENKTESNYLLLLKQGIQELFRKDVRWIVPLYFLVQGCSYMIFTGGILRPLLYEKSGLPVDFHSYAVSLALLFTVIFMFVVRKWNHILSTRKGLYSLSFICFLGFAVNIESYSLILSLLGLMALQVASYSLMPLLSTALNHQVSSQHRATTISAANFLQGLLYVLLAPLIGWLSLNGQINLVAAGVTSIVLLGIGISVFFCNTYIFNFYVCTLSVIKLFDC